ncbi:MAG: polysaccharide deacetylase family protein [Candidatus Limnocylindrales bacterium]
MPIRQLNRRAFLALAGQGVLMSLGASVVHAAGMTPVFHGRRDERVIALTIDDGWSPGRTRAIFDVLQRGAVAATFFPYAEAAELDRGLWRAIADAGYPIGNHTQSHPFMTTLGPDAQAAELVEARSTIETMTGRPMLAVFRPPYGAYDSALLALAARTGFPTVLMWDTSAADTSRWATPEQLVAAALRGRAGSVLLAHGGPALTPLILPAVIARYRDLGFRFVSVPELLGLPGAPVRAAVRATVPPPVRGRGPL